MEAGSPEDKEAEYDFIGHENGQQVEQLLQGKVGIEEGDHLLDAGVHQQRKDRPKVVLELTQLEVEEAHKEPEHRHEELDVLLLRVQVPDQEQLLLV